MTSIPKKLSKKYNKCINYKMKDYGRDGHQKKGKKKKRKFEVIMNIGNTGTQGIYTDLTLRKVANKVTSKLVGKKKHIIFHLREKGKYEKIYGPYIGSIKDGKAIVRIHKMSGGDLIDCVFNRIKISNFKVNSNNPLEIKITNFCITRSTIIFFNFLDYKQKKYYKYVIYREGNQVIVLELEISDDDKLEIKQIGINEIEKNAQLQQKIILEKIMQKIKEKQVKNPKFALKIQQKIQDQLDSIKNNKNKIFDSPEIFFSQPQKFEPDNQFNKNLNYAVEKIIQTTPRTFLPPNVKIFQKKPSINNSEKELLKIYICPIENFAEVRQNAYFQILFGFDPELFTQNNASSRLYYKYIYIGNNTFRELVKNDRGYFDTQIDISNIPLYDLLCLMEFAKINNIGDLLSLVVSNINFRKQNGLFTISLSDNPFDKLKNSNFNKKRNTNVGKTKKQDLTKTYYFFGEYTPNNFKYACYRLGDQVFYFERNEKKNKKLLEELKDREALQELKSFIILRRFEKRDQESGNIVYQKADEIIRKLKLEEILPKEQISILPRSSHSIL
jgi:hypothetical protein